MANVQVAPIATPRLPDQAAPPPRHRERRTLLPYGLVLPMGVLLAVLIFGGAQSVLFSRAAAGYRHLPEPTSMDAAQATDRRGTRGG